MPTGQFLTVKISALPPVLFALDDSYVPMYQGGKTVRVPISAIRTITLSSRSIGEMSDVDLTGAQSGQSFVWDGAKIVPSAISLSNITGINIQDATEGDLLKIDQSGDIVNVSPDPIYYKGSGEPDSGLGINNDSYYDYTNQVHYVKLGGVWTVENIVRTISVNGGDPVDGDVNITIPTPSLPNLTDVSDTVTSGSTDGQMLVKSGSEWINSNGPVLKAATETEAVAPLTGASTTWTLTVDYNNGHSQRGVVNVGTENTVSINFINFPAGNTGSVMIEIQFTQATLPTILWKSGGEAMVPLNSSYSSLFSSMTLPNGRIVIVAVKNNNGYWVFSPAKS